MEGEVDVNTMAAHAQLNHVDSVEPMVGDGRANIELPLNRALFQSHGEDTVDIIARRQRKHLLLHLSVHLRNLGKTSTNWPKCALHCHCVTPFRNLVALLVEHVPYCILFVHNK